MFSTMVHVRVDEEVKESAAAALAKMGLSISDAVRLMPVLVATEKALPFEVRVPKATTVRAMQSTDEKKGKRFRTAEDLFDDLGIWTDARDRPRRAFRRDVKLTDKRHKDLGSCENCFSS